MAIKRSIFIVAVGGGIFDFATGVNYFCTRHMPRRPAGGCLIPETVAGNSIKAQQLSRHATASKWMCGYVCICVPGCVVCLRHVYCKRDCDCHWKWWHCNELAAWIPTPTVDWHICTLAISLAAILHPLSAAVCSCSCLLAVVVRVSTCVARTWPWFTRISYCLIIV